MYFTAEFLILTWVSFECSSLWGKMFGVFFNDYFSVFRCYKVQIILWYESFTFGQLSVNMESLHV